MNNNLCPNGWGSRYGYSNKGCRCYSCKKSQADYVKKWRHENSEKHRQSSNNYRKRNPDKIKLYAKNYRSSKTFIDRINFRKNFVNNIKIKKGCIDCGYNKHPEALHFDHIKGKKEFEISSRSKCSLKDLIKEIKKCEIRCANCHAIKTAERRENDFLIRKMAIKMIRKEV